MMRRSSSSSMRSSSVDMVAAASHAVLGAAAGASEGARKSPRIAGRRACSAPASASVAREPCVVARPRSIDRDSIDRSAAVHAAFASARANFRRHAPERGRRAPPTCRASRSSSTARAPTAARSSRCPAPSTSCSSSSQKFSTDGTAVRGQALYARRLRGGGDRGDRARRDDRSRGGGRGICAGGLLDAVEAPVILDDTDGRVDIVARVNGRRADAAADEHAAAGGRRDCEPRVVRHDGAARDDAAAGCCTARRDAAAARGDAASPVHREASWLHLTVLQAAPLVVQRDEAGGRRMYSMQQLNLPSEREKITDMLREGEEDAEYLLRDRDDRQPAPRGDDGRQRAPLLGPWQRSFSFLRGRLGRVARADAVAAAVNLRARRSGRQAASARQPPPRLPVRVPLAGRRQSLEKLGVPHVIAVQSSAQILDAAAVAFTRHLYLALPPGTR